MNLHPYGTEKRWYHQQIRLTVIFYMLVYIIDVKQKK